MFLLVKLAANIVAGLGVTKVVDEVIKNNTTVLTTFDAIRVMTGRVVLGSMILDRSSDFVNEQLDDYKAWRDKKEADKETPPTPPTYEHPPVNPTTPPPPPSV